MNFLLPLLEPKKKKKGSIQGVWFVNVEEKADKESIKLKRTSRGRYVGSHIRAILSFDHILQLILQLTFSLSGASFIFFFVKIKAWQLAQCVRNAVRDLNYSFN